MTRAYEFYTWRNDEAARKMNDQAIEAARQYKGRKFTVAFGEWIIRTFLVFADSKEEAKVIALNAFGAVSDGSDINTNKVKIREVTNCKKYQ